MTLYGTKSWDYGILRFSLNGAAAKEVDAYDKSSLPTGPVDLGAVKPIKGRIVLRVEVIGGNSEARGNRSFFGLDCITLDPLAKE